MIDRRDILKLFGIGAAIAPVIGGVPATAYEAVIVEPPKVELVKAREFISGPFGDLLSKSRLSGFTDLVVLIRDSKTGDTIRFEAPALITQCRQEMNVITTFRDPFPHAIPSVMTTLDLTVTGEAKVEIRGSR